MYTASEQRKARTKATLIKFLLSRNIRSLRNTTHNNERYVPITGYRRQIYTRTKYINSLGHHKVISKKKKDLHPNSVSFPDQLKVKSRRKNSNFLVQITASPSHLDRQFHWGSNFHF